MIAESTLVVAGRTVRILTSGPTDGPLVVLLHGFPELADSWRKQLTALAEAGYRAVAPDQRGYGGSDQAGPYDAATLAMDIVELIGELGCDRAVVVGHDWGGGVAWTLAALYPEVVAGLAVANCPPPAILAEAMLRSPQQLRKSWYMFFFQIPLLPEYWLTRNRSEIVARSLVGGSFVRSAFDSEDLKLYRDAFSKPGAAKAAVGWYRAALRRPLRARQYAKLKVAAPTLVIWGTQDRFLGQELVEPNTLAKAMAAGNVPEVQYVTDAGHFVQNEAPDAFNDILLGWLDNQHLE